MARPRPVAIVRPPPPPSDPREAFIRGEDPEVRGVPETPPGRPLDVHGASTERPPDASKALVTRQSGRQTRRTTVHFRPETFAALEAWCAAEGEDLSRVVDRAVRELLAQGRPG